MTDRTDLVPCNTANVVNVGFSKGAEADEPPVDPETQIRELAATGFGHVIDLQFQLPEKHKREAREAAKREIRAERAAIEADERRRTVPPPKDGPTLTPESFAITAADLDALDFPPVRFVVDGLLPRGLAILAAAPKIGKTWLDMGLAHAVASGGLFAGSKATDAGDVLLLDLEGNGRRAQKRMRAVRQGQAAPAGLMIANTWPRMNLGGLDLIRQWATARPSARLVIIDVWNRFRPPIPKGSDTYQHDADTLAQLQKLALDCDLAIIIVHHTRKSADADWASEISGTQGIAGTVDTIWSIRRERGKADAVLNVTGRDVEDQELALKFDGDIGAWTILGDASEVLMSNTRQTIHSALCFAGRAMKPAEVAAATDLSRELVKRTLLRMMRDGTVKADAGGAYTAESGTNH